MLAYLHKLKAQLLRYQEQVVKVIKKRLPEDDIIALEQILMSNEWKIVIKYIGQLHGLQKNKFFDKPVDDMLLYERGKIEGSKELVKLIRDFKDYFRAEYIRK